MRLAAGRARRSAGAAAASYDAAVEAAAAKALALGLGLIAVLAGCGGGGGGGLSLEGYSDIERRAIEQAQTVLETVYDLRVDEVTEVDRNEFGNELTRVEVETADGHLCVYFQNAPVGAPVPEPEPDEEGLYLLSIKAGPICSELIYDASN